MKIVFIGTPNFAAVILKGLIENNYKPVLVVTGPDKPVGRKKIITPLPVKIAAQKYNILIEQPNQIQNSKLKIQNSAPDLIICAAYGQIIPKEILKIPKYGCINVHPSLLPKYRGPSPIQTAILNGDKKTGVTIYLMDEKIDHGPILAQQELKIPNPNDQSPNKSQVPITKIDYEKLSDKLAELGVKLLIETIPKWIKGEIEPRPQNESKATYTKIITKKDGEIDWNNTASKIERQIRAFRPWPGTFTFLKKNNKIIRVKILEAEVSKEFKEFSIKCKKDYLIIKKLQPESKRPMRAQEFKKGYNGLF